MKVKIELLAVSVVMLGFILNVAKKIELLSLPNYYILLISSCFMITILLSVISANLDNDKPYRPKASSETFCCALIPMSIVLQRKFTFDLENSELYSTFEEVFSLGSFISALIVSRAAICPRNNASKKADTNTFYACDIILLLTSGSWILFSVFRLDNLRFFLLLVQLAFQSFVQRSLPRWLPSSFTLGEAAILAQAFSLFLLLSGTDYMTALNSKFSQEMLTIDLQARLFTETAVISCAIVIAALVFVRRLRSTFGYYSLVCGVTGLFSFPVLMLFFGQDFVSWLVVFICQDRLKIFLFLYWSLCSVASVGIVYFNAVELCAADSSRDEPFAKNYNALPQASRSTGQQTDIDIKQRKCAMNEDSRMLERPTMSCEEPSEKDVCMKRHASTAIRKQFHLLATAILVPGLLFDMNMLKMAAGCALVVLVMLESLRVLRVAPFGDTLHTYFEAFRDDQDGGLVILTHIYLLVGCSAPLWLSSQDVPTLAHYSGLISLGVGDTAASVIGSRFGRHHWTGSPKTLEGTCAAMIGQFVFLYLLYITGIVHVPWLSSILAVVLVSLLEAFTSQIDNLILPLFMFTLLNE